MLRQTPDVDTVHPVQLLVGENRRRSVHPEQVKEVSQFLSTKDLPLLTLPRSPPEKGQKVEHSLGQVTVLAELGNGRRTVTLGQWPPISAVHQREMAKDREFPAQHAIEQNTLGGSGNPTVVPGDMGDFHVMVVHYHRQMVSGKTIRFEENQVV